MENIVKLISILAVFGPPVVTDIRKREIPVVYCLMSGLFFTGMKYFLVKDMTRFNLYGMGFGLLFVMMSFFTRSFGTGDGVLILLYGLLYGLSEQIQVLILGLLILAIYGSADRLMHQKGRDAMYPFAPFFFAGAVICQILLRCGI